MKERYPSKLENPFYKKKANYAPPKIELQLVEYEEGLCNGSAIINIGTENNQGILIETWDGETGWTEKQESNFDI